MESIKRSDKILLELMHIGHVAGCHQMESRSFSFKGYQFPLCARCTGIVIGYFAGFFLFALKIRPGIPVLMLLSIPCAADGLIQEFTPYESNNLKRLVSGFLIGIAYIQFIFLIIMTALKLCHIGHRAF